MKIVRKKQCILISAIALAFIVGIMHFSNGEKRLSDSEIAALRDVYPVCGSIPSGMEMRTLSLEESIHYVDSFVYGEITGNTNTYDVNISYGEAIDAKRESFGLSNVDKFYDYSLTIIKDSEGILNEGAIITLSSNAIFKPYFPQFQEGMRFVIPLKRYTNVQGQYGYILTGMYYVTDEGYAISAFEETNVRSAKSGMKVEELLKELKKK